MSATTGHTEELEHTELKRSITGKQLFFYVLGDVLGSGIYVLVGAVAAAVGGAFWLAFLVGVTITTLTGMAYAELVTKHPRAAGASLYVNRAFGSAWLTFLVTVAMLASSFAASGALASGFAGYFATVWEAPPALLVAIAFVLALCVINYIGISESVVANVVMTFVEVAGLAIVLLIGIIHVAKGDADFGVLGEFKAEGSPILALVSGVALGFFAMTGFENAANVAEECTEPRRTFPRALIGGMIGAGIIYVAVAVSAALTVPIGTLADSDAALLEVVETGILPLPLGFLTILFSLIAMTAITNTTLVTFVTQARIMYGMAKEDVFPQVFDKVHSTRRSPWVGLLFSALVVTAILVISNVLPPVNDQDGNPVPVVSRLAAVTVLLLLFVYSMVIVSALRLRGRDDHPQAYRAPTALLLIGLVGNVVLLGYVVYSDPVSVVWSLALIGLGVALFLIEKTTGGGTPASSDTAGTTAR